MTSPYTIDYTSAWFILTRVNRFLGMLLAAALAYRYFLKLKRPKFFQILLILLVGIAVGIGTYYFNVYILSGINGPMLILTLFLLMYLIHRQNISTTFIVTLFSLALSLVCFFFSVFISAPIDKILSNYYPLLKEQAFRSYPMMAIMLVLTLLFFRFPRYRNGLPYLKNGRFNLVGAFFCFCFIMIMSFLQGEYMERINAVIGFAGLGIYLAMGAVCLVWIWSRSQQEYLTRVNAREMKTLSESLDRQIAENDRLSSLLHRDNKLLSSMLMAVDEVLGTLAEPADENEASAAALQAASLRKELQALSDERLDKVRSYELSGRPLKKTGLSSIDMQLSYMQKRAASEGIFLDFVCDGSLKTAVPDTLSETELVTLLADLLENAIFATASAGGDRILLFLGFKNDRFCIEVSDTGVPFPDSVLEAYGKKRFTTRAKEGGTGIGLETLYAIASNHNAEFRVEPLSGEALYRKTIRVAFPLRKPLPIVGALAEKADSSEKDASPSGEARTETE